MASSHATGYGGGAAALAAGTGVIAVSRVVAGNENDIAHQPLFWVGIVGICIGVLVLLGVSVHHLLRTLGRSGNSDSGLPISSPDQAPTDSASQLRVQTELLNPKRQARQEPSEVSIRSSVPASVIGQGSRATLTGEPSIQPTSAAGYREIYVSAHYIYRHRTPSRVIVHRTIEPISEPITEFKVPFNLPNDLREGIGGVEPLTNCALVSSKYLRSTGMMESTLSIPTNDSDEPVSFSYEIKLLSDKDDRPYLRHIARTDGSLFVLEAQFDLQDLPASVYFFEKVDYWNDIEDVPMDQSVVVNTAGFVRVEFRDYQPPDTFGILFEWPERGSGLNAR